MPLEVAGCPAILLVLVWKLLRICKFIDLVKVKEDSHIVLQDAAKLKNVTSPVHFVTKHSLEEALDIIDNLLGGRIKDLSNVYILGLAARTLYRLSLLHLSHLEPCFWVNDWISHLSR